MMRNNLTNGMRRLSCEISDLRHNRAALTRDLVLGRAILGNTVSEMIVGFRRDREKMREKTRAEVTEFMRDLRCRLTLARANLENTVSEMIVGFRRDREKMGEKTRAEVAEFMSDLMGARAAWSGSAAERKPPRSNPRKRSHKAHSKIERKKR